MPPEVFSDMFEALALRYIEPCRTNFRNRKQIEYLPVIPKRKREEISIKQTYKNKQVFLVLGNEKKSPKTAKKIINVCWEERKTE